MKGKELFILGTFSKSFLPAVWLSYIVLPPSLMVQYSRKFAVYNQPVSPIYSEGNSPVHAMGKFRKAYSKNVQDVPKKTPNMRKSIEQYMGTQVKIVGEKSGLHILLKLKRIKALELIERALKKGVKVYSPAMLWLHPPLEADSYIMLGLGGLSIEEIENGVRLLASCLL